MGIGAFACRASALICKARARTWSSEDDDLAMRVEETARSFDMPKQRLKNLALSGILRKCIDPRRGI